MAATTVAVLSLGAALLAETPLRPTAGVVLAAPPTAPVARIGIEAGHGNGDPGSASCDGSVREAGVTFAVAQHAAWLLRAEGHSVEVFRGDAAGTLPKERLTGYQADAFVALHTDYCAGNNSGFKATRYGGAPVTGIIGNGDPSDRLTDAIWTHYGAATGLPEDRGSGHFTPNMRYYWAINPTRAIAPSTPGAIIEMGWLSGDKAFMASVAGQQRMARGVANAVTAFLGGASTMPEQLPVYDTAAGVPPETAG